MLQKQLPPSLLQLPPAEQCHSAGAVLQFYQQQLSSALEDHAACAAALACLQRIGNCVALLHLLSIESAVHATPVFMQVCRLCRLHTGQLDPCRHVRAVICEQTCVCWCSHQPKEGRLVCHVAFACTPTVAHCICLLVAGRDAQHTNCL